MSLRSKLFILIILAATLGGVAALFLWLYRPPHFNTVKSSYTSSEQILVDRQGRVLEETRVEKKFRRLSWVELDQISEPMSEALTRAEDRRFYSHFGIDLLAMTKAFYQRVFQHQTRGASTISMQLYGLLEPSIAGRKGLATRRDFLTKIRQMIGAMALERYWSKKQILEAYFNLIHFRGELQGVNAAALGFFDKTPLALTRADAATLVAMIRAPSSQVTLIKNRACTILQNWPGAQCEELNSIPWNRVEKGYEIRSQSHYAYHAARRILKDPQWNKKGVVQTTLDYNLQRVVQNALYEQISKHRAENMSDGAAVVIDNKTGDILAYVGNIGTESKAFYVDGAQALRQAGSTLKPLLFGKAIDSKLITAATVLKDSPLEVPVQTGVYRPMNFDKSYRQWVTAREALASSMNIPAVQVLLMLGVDSFHQTLINAGITGLQNADYYGPSMALGSADVKLIELTNAFRSIANSGVWTPTHMIKGEKDNAEPRRVLSDEAAFIIKSIISDRESRASTFGLENPLSTSYWSAAKTGTSKDMRDNWCIGFSSRYTVGVWAGNFNGAPMWNVSGIQGAAPAWVSIMNWLHTNESSLPPEPPAGVMQKHVVFDYSKQTRDEWFINGTEPNVELIKVVEKNQSKLRYPLKDDLIAIDPDIPKENGKVFFQVTNPKKGQLLYLNGKKFSEAKEFVSWVPAIGKYTLELREKNGSVIDSIPFQVRGRRFQMPEEGKDEAEEQKAD